MLFLYAQSIIFGKLNKTLKKNGQGSGTREKKIFFLAPKLDCLLELDLLQPRWSGRVEYGKKNENFPVLYQN